VAACLPLVDMFSDLLRSVPRNGWSQHWGVQSRLWESMQNFHCCGVCTVLSVSHSLRQNHETHKFFSSGVSMIDGGSGSNGTCKEPSS
jgi:hypothetical protein